ncbi:MAG: M949_RS01915 family surface polysaccharide biosynthesis protein [Cytophagaceae bacterium]
MNSFVGISISFLTLCCSCQTTHDNVNDQRLIDENGSLVENLKMPTDFNEDVVFFDGKIDTTVVVDRKLTPYKGNIRYKGSWADSTGRNLLIISGTLDYQDGKGRNEIFAYKYVKENGKWLQVCRINDFVDGIGCDLSIKLPKEYIEIRDLDSNGVAETSFIYTLDNRCDAVMVETKMIIFINQKKYVIRGFSDTWLMPNEDLYNSYRAADGLPPVLYKDIDQRLNEFPDIKKYYSSIWDQYNQEER